MARSRRLTLFRRTALALAACAVLPAAAQARVLADGTLGPSDATVKTYAPAYGFGQSDAQAAPQAPSAQVAKTYAPAYGFGQSYTQAAPHGPIALHRSRLVLQRDGRLVARPAAPSTGPTLRVVGTSEPAVATVQPAVSNGFHWDDAGIGAGVAVAAGALLALLAVVAVRGRTGRGGLAGA
jgi:hypothetical protein